MQPDGCSPVRIYCEKSAIHHIMLHNCSAFPIYFFSIFNMKTDVKMPQVPEIMLAIIPSSIILGVAL